MKLGEYHELISETSDFPGSIGDSCANTARQFLLFHHLNSSDRASFIPALVRFRTPAGYVRHWTAPLEWREYDMSTDQSLPLYLAYKECAPYLASEMKQRIFDKGWTTGNGDFISPGFFAELYDSQVLRTLFLLVQILLFKLPYRWNDERKWFEATGGSSADYLNFLFVAIKAPYWVRRLIKKEVLKKKIYEYFATEPNNTWVVHNYFVFIERYF